MAHPFAVLAVRVRRRDQSGSAPAPRSAAGDWADRELTFGLLAHEQLALEEMDDAFGRIHEGRYGICEGCICEFSGQPIPRRRLEAISRARPGIEAQAELERARGKVG